MDMEMPVRVFFMLPSGCNTHSWMGGGGGIRMLSRTESAIPLFALGTCGLVSSKIEGGCDDGFSGSAEACTHRRRPARTASNPAAAARPAREQLLSEGVM